MSKRATIRIVRTEPSPFVSLFSELFCNTIPILYDIKRQKFLNDVKEALKKIRKLIYEINTGDVKFSEDFTFAKPAVRWAYVYSYSVLNTGVVYFEFLKYLKENRDVFVRNFSVKTLKICCLGGGSGTEAIGICKAIHDIIWSSSSQEENSLVDVHVTVVDICSEWKTEGSTIINVLNNTSNFFCSKRVKFHAEFLNVDLLKPFEEPLRKKINESNIITIVKLANAIQENHPSNCSSKLENMMKSVIDCMEDDSCLFMLDTAGGKMFYSMMKVVSKHEGSFKLQENRHKAYRLFPETLKKLECAMNFETSNPLLPTLLTKVSSCIWIKNTIPVEPVPIKTCSKKKKEKKATTKRL